MNALPSMCVGRTPDEALDIVLDALPTVLGCDLVYLKLPGSPAKERASLKGAPGELLRPLPLHLLVDELGDWVGDQTRVRLSK